MKALTLIHVGDIHYPQALSECIGDVKDQGFPSRVADLTMMRPLQCVLRALEPEVRHADAILFSGDLTSAGDASAYDACVGRLTQALNLGGWPLQRIHVVPGNHDVDHGRVDPNGNDLLSKFSEFAAAWAKRDLPVLAVGDVRSSEVAGADSCRAAIISVNSCIGCGEVRHLPQKIRKQLEDMLKALTEAEGIASAFSIIGETLDSPGFRVDDIDTICGAIEGLHNAVLPVILSHHNLLPQVLPRVELYTEVINSGLVRSRFAHLKRPVLYCHGHVHSNPLEIVHQPGLMGSQLICISAPKLTRGFNVLRIMYGSRGYPLGCEIQHSELDVLDGGVRKRMTAVRFYKPDQRVLQKLGHEALPTILAQMPGTEVRFIDLEEQFSSRVPAVTRKALAEALLEGEWLGTVQIVDKEDDPEYWNLRKVVR